MPPSTLSYSPQSRHFRLLLLFLSFLLLTGRSFALDTDNDGITDTIDPNPGLTNPKLTLTGTVSGGYTMQILGSGRVASIRNTSGTAWFNSTVDGADLADVTPVSLAILDQFKDEFDFIFLASNRSSSPTSEAGVHHPVTNSWLDPATGNVMSPVAGIGTVLTNGATIFGSTGRLQSFLHLSTRNGLRRGPALHELMHRWGNKEIIPTAESGHWGYSSVGGTLGGYKAGTRTPAGTGAGTYRARSPRSGEFGGWSTNDNGPNSVPYSQFELYLMGMIGSGEVTDVIEVANGVTGFDSDLGQFTTTGITTLTMPPAGFGTRTPLPASAQKKFRAILVVLTASDLTNAEWAAADETVQNFSLAGDNGDSDYNFLEATGGRGTMSMTDLCQSLKTPPSDTVSTTQTSVTFPPAGGSQTVNIMATGAWTIGSLPAWLTASPLSGTGNAAVTLTARANNGLDRAIHLGIANVCGSACLPVTQPSSVASPAFSISAASRVVPAPGTSYTFTVTSNVAWSVGTPLPSSPRPSWISSISPSSGTGNATVTVTYASMVSFNDPIRQAELTIGERILPEDIFVPFATHTVTQVPATASTARDTALDTAGLFYASFGDAAGWNDASPPAGAANGNALGSGTTPNDGISLLRTFVAGPSEMSFRWKVSSEANADELILNVNGTYERIISGEQDWATVTRRFPAGTHTISWEYQKNAIGAAGSDRGWVDQVVITALNPATLTTAAPASVTAGSALLGGNVTATGTGTVTERGIVWGRYASPTTGDNKVSHGTGAGAFSGTVTGLPANTALWVRSYAINSFNGSTFATSYGDNQCFQTAVAAPTLTGLVLTPTGVITTSQWGLTGDGTKDNMINSSGLTGAGSDETKTHDAAGNAFTMWHAGPNAGGIAGGTVGNPPAVNSQAIEFDLGANYDLTGVHVWNINQPVNGSAERGIRGVEIFTSPDATGTTWTSAGVREFTQGTGAAGLAAQAVAFTGSNTRRVRFAIATAWSGAANEYVGLSEVRFRGTVAATVPSAPVIGTATAGNASASVAFAPPASNGGSAITGYTVTSSPGGITATGAASPISITGLTNGTAYTFTVRATNAIGPGPASGASNSVTPATVPSAPVIGTATAGNASASVAFTPPASNGGSVITGYTVTSSLGGITATGAASPISVTGLTNGTAYTFTVRATNAIGPGPASASSNSVTPVAPSTVGAVAGTNLPLPIPDNNLTGADVLFPVSGRTGTVTALSVQFTLNPAHTFASDLSVQLIAPDNTMTPIFNIGVDDDSDLGGPYTFQDSAAGYLSTAASFVGPLAVVASGTYRAENSGNQILLNTVFASKAPNGTWRLRFIDLSGIDTGTVSQASLTLTTSAAPATGPNITLVTLPNGNRQLTLTDATPNTSYLLRRSTNLTTWVTVATTTTNAAGSVVHTDTTTQENRFFYKFEPQ